MHSYIGTAPTDTGYVGTCECGWSSAVKLTGRSAQGAVAAHIGHPKIAPSSERPGPTPHRVGSAAIVDAGGVGQHNERVQP